MSAIDVNRPEALDPLIGRRVTIDYTDHWDEQHSRQLAGRLAGYRRLFDRGACRLQLVFADGMTPLEVNGPGFQSGRLHIEAVPD